MAADRLVNGVQFSTIALALADIGNLAGTGVNKIKIKKGTYNEVIFTYGKTNYSPTDYISVEAISGDEHHGIFGAGVIINSTGLGGCVIADYCKISDIEINSDIRYPLQSYGVDAVGNNILMKQNCSDADPFAFDNALPGTTVTWNKCVAWNVYGVAAGEGFRSMSSANMICNNCISYGYTNGFYSWSGGSISVYNSFTEGSALYITSGSNNSFTPVTGHHFVDYLNGNFHVTSSSDLIGAGIDKSGDFTTDIDGDTIADWMIGVDYVATPPPSGDTHSKTENRYMRRLINNRIFNAR